MGCNGNEWHGCIFVPWNVVDLQCDLVLCEGRCDVEMAVDAACHGARSSTEWGRAAPHSKGVNQEQRWATTFRALSEELASCGQPMRTASHTQCLPLSMHGGCQASWMDDMPVHACKCVSACQPQACHRGHVQLHALPLSLLCGGWVGGW